MKLIELCIADCSVRRMLKWKEKREVDLKKMRYVKEFQGDILDSKVRLQLAAETLRVETA